MNRKTYFIKQELNSIYRYHRRTQDFSKGGSHCVKVRVLVCLDIFKLKRHGIFADRVIAVTNTESTEESGTHLDTVLH